MKDKIYMERNDSSLVVRTIALCIVAVVAGMSQMGGCASGGGGSSGPDLGPPTFGGATSAVSMGKHTIQLSWTNGTDDQTPSVNILYNVYRNTGSIVTNFSTPLAVSTPGGYSDPSCDATTSYFYVVRAIDEAGNEETNTVQVQATTGSAVSWANEAYPFLVGEENSCLNCHVGGSPPNGLDLSTDSIAYSALVGQDSPVCSGPSKRVVASDGANSLLYQKLMGTQNCGSQMPAGGPYLDSVDIDKFVKAWIDEGALNN